MMACTVINILNRDGHSAMPGAPVVKASPARRLRLARLRGWIATGLHRAAWVIEPEAQPVVETCR